MARVRMRTGEMHNAQVQRRRARAVRCKRGLDGRQHAAAGGHAASLLPPAPLLAPTADANDGLSGIGIEATPRGGGFGPPPDRKYILALRTSRSALFCLPSKK